MAGFLAAGELVVYSAHVMMDNCTITEGKKGDGLNIKYCSLNVLDCRFESNTADQLDLDFCSGTVTNCVFKPAFDKQKGDGLDLYRSDVTVQGCDFSGFEEKGISVRGKSSATVNGCSFTMNNSALSIKDGSVVTTTENNFDQNEFVFSLYLKKQLFGMPVLNYSENIAQDKISNDGGQVNATQ